MLFRFKQINRKKILQHGFEVQGDIFFRRQKFLDDFMLTIIIDNRGSVTTKIFDADGEPYTLHLVEDAAGSFVGAVKAEHERILAELAAQCFDDKIFSSRQAQMIIVHIGEHFNAEPEFLWKNFPQYAIFRRSDNRKWYAVIMRVPKRFLHIGGNDELEILNLRVVPDELDKLVDNEKYFRGWHMNKRSWMTLRLDDILADDELFTRLEQSYQLAGNKSARRQSQ